MLTLQIRCLHIGPAFFAPRHVVTREVVKSLDVCAPSTGRAKGYMLGLGLV